MDTWARLLARPRRLCGRFVGLRAGRVPVLGPEWAYGLKNGDDIIILAGGQKISWWLISCLQQDYLIGGVKCFDHSNAHHLGNLYLSLLVLPDNQLSYPV